MLYVNVRGTGRLSSAPHGSSPTTLKKRGLVMDMLLTVINFLLG